MVRRPKRWIAACFLLLLAAVLAAFYFHGKAAVKQTAAEMPEKTARLIILRHTADGAAEQIPLEDALVGFLAGEMSAEAPEAALQAQAVAARSYVYARNLSAGEVCDDSAHCLAYLSEEERRKRWGRHFAKYEEKLKEVRGELKKLIYEYNVLAQAAEDLTDSKAAEEVLQQLSIIIKKIEELKEKIKIENPELENDTYLTEIVDQYIEEFNNKNTVTTVKDSELYIMIADKLEEVTEKTETLTNKVEDTKEKLELDEETFANLKESYYNFENFNNQLIAFHSEQDYLL